MKRWPFAAAFLALAGCVTVDKEPPPRPFVGTRWEVILELPLSGAQPQMRFGDGRVEGFGGCSKFAARYVQDAVGARAIAIGRIEVDRRICPDASAQAAESHVLEVLQAVSSFTITGQMMEMAGSAGALRFRAVVSAAPPLVGTRWKGVVDPLTDSGNVPWIEFSADKVAGFTGCNQVGGTWQNEAGAIRLGALAVTKRACVGPAAEIERRVLAAVNDRSRIGLEGAKLIFIGPTGERFEFAAH
jgi:heat shock protein HslJ